MTSVDGEDPGPDPFDGLELDDRWISGAAVREPSARSRSTRAEIDRLGALQDQAAAADRRRARRRRRMRRALPFVAVGLFAVAVAVVNDTGDSPADWVSPADQDQPLAAIDAHPTPRAPDAAHALRTAAHPDAHGGAYEFLSTQLDGHTPIAYDPCRTIHIVVNDRTMPEGAKTIVADAVEEISRVSGLDLQIDGPTDERPGPQRQSFQRKRYGDRWAPVLVAWSDDAEAQILAGDVVGAAASAWTTAADTRVYVSGLLVLDGPDAQDILREDHGRTIVENVVLHELGHLVGLAHVHDKGELMYPVGQRGIVGLQRGDRTGLTKLGRGRCVPRI